MHIRSIFALTMFLCASGAAAAGGYEVLDLESMGIPSPARQKEAWRVSELFPFEGRLYLGTGDAMVNTGACPVLALDPETGEVTREFTVDDEAVLRFALLDGALAIPGVDATESWEFGNIYVREDGGWVKHRTLPKAVHVNDLASYEGGWFATTGTVLEFDERTQLAAGSILLSMDRGKSWMVDHLTAASAAAVHRVDALEEFEGKLYAFAYAYAGFPEETVPEGTRELCFRTTGPDGKRYCMLYVPDAGGAAESLVRTETGWRPVDLVPEKDVCHVSPIRFRDRLLLSVTSGKRLSTFATYYLDRPIPVPGARYALYDFDGETSKRVAIEYDGLLDVLVTDGVLSLLVLKDGHFWIAETRDLSDWRWLALPLDRGRPLCLARRGDTYFLGMRDGNLFRSTGTIRSVDSVEAIGEEAVSGFHLRGDLPREAYGYRGAITRWTVPGATARAHIAFPGPTSIRLETENVAGLRLFLPGCVTGEGIGTLTIDGLELPLDLSGGRVFDLTKLEIGGWAMGRGEGTLQEYVPEPQVVGQCVERFFRQDSGIVRWVAQAMRDATGADIAILPLSTVRGALEKGPVTIADVRDLVYPNRVLVMEFTGRELISLLAANLEAAPRDRCDYVGPDATIDVVAGKVVEGDFDPDRTYEVALTDYAANRGERFFGRELETPDAGDFVHDVIVARLRKTGEIGPYPPVFRVIGGEAK